MNCPIASHKPEMLVDYAAGQLDLGSSRELEQHLAGCASCRSAAADQAAVWNALDAWEAPAIPSDFNRRLYQRIEDGVRLSWWERLTRSFRPMPLRTALPLTATAGLLVIAGFLLQHQPATAPAAPQGSIVRADQVERTLDDLDLLRQFSAANTQESVHSHAM
ncbi:MAG: anti-sigma factor family protein [Bryobacteraceae bacterium]